MKKILFSGVLCAFSGAAFAHDVHGGHGDRTDNNVHVWNETEYPIHVKADEANDAQGVFEARPFNSGGPPLHIHDAADEVVYVVVGEVLTVIDGEVERKGPGDAIFVPRGVPHTYTILSEGGARLLAVMTPGGFEAFFEAAATEGLAVPQDMERLQELSAEHALRFVGPPLAPDAQPTN